MRVLLIDDVEEIREIVTESLADYDIDVTGVAYAEDALVLLGSGEDYDLIVTDVDLGEGLSGIDLAEVARTRHPDIELIFISGRAVDREGRSPQPHERLLLKPFRPAQLLDLIREVSGT